MEQIVYTSLTTNELVDLIKNCLKEELSKSIEDSVNKRNDTESYLTRKEVAQKLKISLPTLNQLTKSGILTSYRIGGRVLYNEHEVLTSLVKIKTNKFNKRSM